MTDLAKLTNGVVNSLSDLTESKIEDILGFQVQEGTLNPLYNGDGSPILKADGSQLILSFSHAAIFADHIAKLSLDKTEDFTLQDVKNLPVPHWRPVHGFVASNDGYAVLSVRGNGSKVAQGGALYTAADNPVVLEQENRGETPQENLERILEKQTGLYFDELAEGNEAIIRLAGIEDGPLDSYSLHTSEGMKSGIVPAAVLAIGVKSDLSRDEIFNRAATSHFLVGMLAVKLEDIKKLSKNFNSTVPATFRPSAVLNKLLPDEAAQIQEAGNLNGLREKLGATGQIALPGNYSLKSAIEISVTGADFTVPGGQHLRMVAQLADALEAPGLQAGQVTKPADPAP